MTVAVDWDVKHQTNSKQNQRCHCDRQNACVMFCIQINQHFTKEVLNFKEALYFWA